MITSYSTVHNATQTTAIGTLQVEESPKGMILPTMELQVLLPFWSLFISGYDMDK